MMTVRENTASSMSQPFDYNNYRSYPTTYDYRPNYAAFSHQSSSFETMSNIHNFYRRHTESPSIYSSSTSNQPPSIPFDYSSGMFFGPSLMRTHSASYPDYSAPDSYPTIHDKSRASTHPYPSFFNLIPPTNYSILPPPPALPPNPLVSHQPIKRSKVNKRPRLTAHIRREILKVKSLQPTIFVWEIQQKLLQNGICTSQTVPTAAAIQRVLNESLKNSVTVKEEAQIPINRPSVTICLSPSPSPTLSNGESHSECSICLESYRSGQEVSILACSHEYHSSCIGEWMLKNRSCPMCRKDIHNQPQFVTLLI